MTTEIAISSWVGLIPLYAMAILGIVGMSLYAFRHIPSVAKVTRAVNYTLLVRGAVWVRIGYAGLLSVLQYYAWANFGKMGESFLNAPLGSSIPVPFIQQFPGLFNHPLGYFLFYSYGRFWLNALISLLVAWAFYKFLFVLKRYNGRFFEEGETELGYLMALIVGWPAFTVFVPLIFVFVVLVSLFRLIVFKETLTTLGWAFICATLVASLYGNAFLSLLGWSALKI